MNHSRARRFKATLGVLLALCISAPNASAQTGRAPTFWFAGTRLIFDAPVALDGDVAVSIHDSGLQRLLARVGASLAFDPQQRYVVLTSADRRIVGFTIGDVRYSVGGVVATRGVRPIL